MIAPGRWGAAVLLVRALDNCGPECGKGGPTEPDSGFAATRNTRRRVVRVVRLSDKSVDFLPLDCQESRLSRWIPIANSSCRVGLRSAGK
jgi:hypothetical protein